jgi:hypothetical protein
MLHVPSLYRDGREEAREQRPLLAALAGKAEAHLVSIDGDMVILESGEAVAAVLFGVVVIAYADERGF